MAWWWWLILVPIAWAGVACAVGPFIGQWITNGNPTDETDEGED